MNNTLAKIYTLIMLECRLPLEEASKLFKVSKALLEDAIRTKTGLYKSFKYLEIECINYPAGLARAKWKAEIYLRRLQKILRVQDKAERVRLLNEFIVALAGPNIMFAIDKCQKYTDEEKNAIMKYRLKYAVSGLELQDSYHVKESTLALWEEKLPDDSELKIRLGILRNYLNYNYQKNRIKSKRQNSTR